ncbi:hypothetical protein GCM10020331_011780 [Ectobacillus funiculus]
MLIDLEITLMMQDKKKEGIESKWMTLREIKHQKKYKKMQKELKARTLKRNPG